MDWKKIWEAAKWPMVAAVVLTISQFMAVMTAYPGSPGGEFSAKLGLIIVPAIFLCLALYLGFISLRKYNFKYDEAAVAGGCIGGIIGVFYILISIFLWPVFVLIGAIFALIGAFIAKKLK